jgi:hypothetical protein
MFDFFQPRKNVNEAINRSAEAVASSNPPKALAQAGSAQTSSTTPSPQNGNAESPIKVGPEALNKPSPDSKIDRESVVALNVKVVCDLAGLLPDKAKYEVTRGQAIGLALSIKNGTCRNFAVDHVVGLCRRRGEVHVAKELLDQVTDKSLREHILKICPELRHPDLVAPRHT